MKVLQVINSLGTGGAEKLILDSIPYYLEHGITMDVLLLNGEEHPFLLKLKLQPGISIYSLGEGTVYNPFHIFKIAKYINRYDLVHVHLFPALYWVALAKMIRFCKTPLIFTEHNTSNRRRGTIFRWIDRLIYRKYSKIVTIASEVDTKLKSHLRFPNSKFELIQNGVNLKNIQKAKPYNPSEFGMQPDCKIVIQVSSFTPQKDQKTLIKAISHVKVPIHLFLVGTGELVAACQSLVASSNLNDSVTFLGVRMDVPELLKTADIVVLSSNYEGLSLSSLEGMASGKPFVASDVPGLTEIVTGAGILFPKGDDVQLANTITSLCNNEMFAMETAKNCEKRASEYDIKEMVKKYVNLYSKICQSQN
ncbi:glycosyltransferase involved in cell wall biosynthesis [Ulvibacter sp. MAR_2010_11]|uniref:glycosyltransferase n=1 Tax=Ulvibacter sp. MAR_2010_11 TaxID=1250229 RepID=UPI000C2C2F41|nr:glycosyltransferase [Ulvibacter sp. MAR_2010_11]PKA84356.1 glycosyltransferase involved in cell wall biosynthesis [Ulvibacter sp. MAR_2010_11]